MENKKTFGMYILQRRRELGMTQHELAERLFVTDSAVSKWERGLSYPDITLLRNICEVLEVSEHELLTGSEDTSARNSERLAQKYLLLTRNYRVAQYLIYGLTLLACAVVNLAVQHRLSWFFIVWASLLLCASLTLAPAVILLFPRLERYSGAITFACFTVNLELLLLVCCLYTRGDWFAVAGVSVLFALTLMFGPFVLRAAPLPEWLVGRRASLYLITETALLFLLLLVCWLRGSGNWLAVTYISVIFALSFFITPVLLRQLPLPEWLNGRRASAYLLIETALLLVLLMVCCLHSGGSWFISAAVGVLFGLGFAIVPVLLRQLPLPEPFCRHKLLLYFAVQSVMLLLVLVVSAPGAFLCESLPTALLCLSLPWGVMAAARYLPLNGCFRAAVCLAWTVLWSLAFPWLLMLAVHDWFGEGSTAHGPWVGLDFRLWGSWHTAQNVYALVLIALGEAALVLCAVGFALERKRSAGDFGKNRKD
ncbi:MAG: helix-turn-helix domain-containing protein [Butyricicoccus sp.]|nr:helix-turn-helix domain-containing protein [Butyricicoccus sp.]